MDHEPTASYHSQPRDPDDHAGADGRDLIREAFTHGRAILSGSGEPHWKIPLARQKEDLHRWAERVGLLLKADDITPRLLRGGQEHDFFREGDRVWKVTRHGIFGLSPGMDLAMVSSSEDARRFHLWEATPLDYLERLLLHNQLIPGLNRLEGVISQPGGDLAIVTSQPRFDIVPVGVAEIDAWFSAQGFQRLTDSAYYRAQDNLGVFDAHDKNVVRAGDLLIPFDVIPCHPDGGFLTFIAETLEAGHRVSVVRTVSTVSAVSTVGRPT